MSNLFGIESLRWSDPLKSSQFEVLLFYVLHVLFLVLRNVIGQTVSHLKIKSQK